MAGFDHKQNIGIGAKIKEIVFGIEDGMVSTLGAITGIAIGSDDRFVVLLAGTVIIAVESVSMGIGSYISNLSEYDVNKKRIAEEKIELEKFPQEEKNELLKMFIIDGWPTGMAQQMVDTAMRDKNLMLKEMAYRELKTSFDGKIRPAKLGLNMFFSYIIGGLIPLAGYFLFPLSFAIKFSVIFTLIGLFCLGAITGKYAKSSWYKTGMRILLLGGLALIIGFLAGKFSSLTYLNF